MASEASASLYEKLPLFCQSDPAPPAPSIGVSAAPRVQKEERVFHGDWQTNIELSTRVCRLLQDKGIRPQILIEPTCGVGNFILAALATFDSLEEVHGIEINPRYLEQLRAKLPSAGVNSQAQVHLHCANVFSFDFHALAERFRGKEVLILGNPPWVTNSKQGALGGANLPAKSNFRNLRGLDAMTGRGNFDIGETVCRSMLEFATTCSAHVALLLKNSVIRNIVQDQREAGFPIAMMQQYQFDTKKEFDVSVAASLMLAKLDKQQPKQTQCTICDLCTGEKISSYGWLDEHFVSDLNAYGKGAGIDGTCPLIWRSGIKHDCAKVMELTKRGETYTNGYGKEVRLEDARVFPLLKSSDLKGDRVVATRKHVCLTQTSTSDNTDTLEHQYPQTYSYLISYAPELDGRKSSIYKGRPRFCLFGIGEYSFSRYKVAVSGLYKEPHFTLISPMEGKPVLLDDTCYQLAFDDEFSAVVTQRILNSSLVREFIKSLSFEDAKRVLNKDLLMRIDLAEAARILGHTALGITQEELHTYLCSLRREKPVLLSSLECRPT